MDSQRHKTFISLAQIGDNRGEFCQFLELAAYFPPFSFEFPQNLFALWIPTLSKHFIALAQKMWPGIMFVTLQPTAVFTIMP
jgi:hypothetical protein